MSFQPMISWWIVPLVATIAAFAWAMPMRADERPDGSMFSGMGYAIGVSLRALAALSLSLLAWLLWALLR